MSRNESSTPAAADRGRGRPASPEEAAAIAAAIEQFLRDTAPAPGGARHGVSPWLRAGLCEAPAVDPAGPFALGDGERWGIAAGGRAPGGAPA